MPKRHWIDKHPFSNYENIGVFTELIAGMGCQGVQMEEIWSLDEATMEELK